MITITGLRTEYNMNDLVELMVYVIIGLCIFYIVTDGIRKSSTGSDAETQNPTNNTNNETQQNPTKKKIDYTNGPGRKNKVEESVAEEVPVSLEELEPQAKSVARNDPTKNNYQESGDTVLKQGNEYEPTNQVATPIIKQATTTITESVNKDTTDIGNNAENNANTESQSSSDDVPVVCMYCGKSLTIKRGTTVTCPSCGGTVEDYGDDLGDLF